MIIRKGQIFDLKSVINIEKNAYDKPYWNESMLKRLFNKDSNEIIWITEIKQQIVGFLIEQRCDDEINLLNLAIDKSFQNRGIGGEMVSCFLSIIPNNSCVFLEVKKNNFIARKIYSNLNFKDIDIRKNYYNDGSDAFIMQYKKYL
ncbi:MAG: ribosomal-protein-alanine N-acetyltransferase [bacterium TMED217]|nr:MAG: ribosomal-protein-alanine N-acetyltransferase [bacterium TMED217]|tara:strand:- start:24775 stop:25212 length:438 start_codon:yes stop_codon:yes gene_type:complete